MVLRAEWKSIAAAAKNHLKMQITACAHTLKAKNEPLWLRCISILSLVDDPWGDQAMKDIFQDKQVDEITGKCDFILYCNLHQMGILS